MSDNRDAVAAAFREEIAHAFEPGATVMSADREFRYSLELQRDRIRKRNIQYTEEMKTSGIFPESLNNVRQWRDGKYVTSWNVNCIDHRKTAKREGMKTYSSRQPQSIYETVIDVAEGEDVSSDTYCCPNCASVSTISELQEGCRHCGTSFKMSELYPKVTNCFYVYDPHGSSDPLWKTIFKYGLYATPFLIPMCILMNIYQMYQLNGVWPTWPEIVSFSIPYIIFGPLACVPVGGFFTWILSHFFIAGRALGKEGPAMIAVGNSRTRFANAMSRISQEYTFENFAAKIVSLFKIIAFSPNPDDLPFYSGKDVKGFFENVVDVSFRGWMACKKVKVKDNKVYVTGDIFTETARDHGDRIKVTNEVYRVTAFRRTDIPVEKNFSISKIQCKSCGGSFNAFKTKSCPFCGTEYSQENTDWVISDIHSANFEILLIRILILVIFLSLIGVALLDQFGIIT